MPSVLSVVKGATPRDDLLIASITDLLPAAGGGEIVLGTWGPLSGPASAWGVVNLAQAAYFRMLNERGGIHARKIRFVVEDDAYDAARTLALVRKMVERDAVLAFLGGLGTASGSAVMPYLVENRVPHIAPASGSSRWSEPPRPGYYAWQMSYSSQARVLATYATEALAKRRLAVFYQRDEFGLEGLAATRAALAARGAELVAEVGYELGEADYSGQALRLLQSGAEATVTWAGVEPYAQLLNASRRLGYAPAWLNSAGTNDPALFRMAPEAVQGAFFIQYLPDPNDPAERGNAAIAEWRENLPRYDPSLALTNFTLAGWGQARLMHEILRRAGPKLSRPGLDLAAQSLKDWQDLATVSYSATDRRGITVGWIAQAMGEHTVKVSKRL